VMYRADGHGVGAVSLRMLKRVGYMQSNML
jgi:hypothetical protein